MGTTGALPAMTRHVHRLPNGATIASEVGGHGPPLVLVHGLGGSGRWWRRNLPVLLPRFRVHLVDLVGFGASRGRPFLLGQAGDALRAWLDLAGIERAAFVGHSMGGYVVARLALDAPDRVDRLVLVDAAGLPLGWDYRRHVLAVIRAALRDAHRLGPVAAHDVLRAGPVTILRAGREILASDLEDRLGDLQVPTLVVWGEQDDVIPLATGRRLAGAIPGARLAVLRRTGHNGMWERPDAFRAAVLPFLTASAGSLAAARSAATDRESAEAESRRDGGRTDGDAFDRLRAAAQERRPEGRTPALRSRYVAIGRHTVHLRHAPGPPGDDLPVLLVHGFVISSRYLAPTAARLRHRHEVIAPDLPGFGWSPGPRKVLDVREHALVLADLLDALNVPRAAVLANSFGCQVAAELAALRPERVAALVLVGPTFDPRAGLATHILRLLRDVPREHPVLWLLHLPDWVLAGPRRALVTLRHARRHRIERVLPRIGVPTLVVRGGADPIVPRRWAEEAAALLPNGRFAEIHGAPHAVNYSRPRDLVATVEAFLRSHGPGGGVVPDAAGGATPTGPERDV